MGEAQHNQHHSVEQQYQPERGMGQNGTQSVGEGHGLWKLERLAADDDDRADQHRNAGNEEEQKRGPSAQFAALFEQRKHG